MHASPVRKTPATALMVLCWFAGSIATLGAQPAQPAETAAHRIAPRSPREFLTTPRETLKSLYFAVVAYDLQPLLISEAAACLDLDPVRAADPAEAARLAIDLEQVLRTLCVPINGVPESPGRDAVTVIDADGFKICLARSADGLWRFDRDTVDRIPAMNRASQDRFRNLQADRAALKDERTDPSTTMRRFLLDTMARDYYSAALCLDLSAFDREERADKGPLLAKQLAFIMQRRGWLFLQEVPNHPAGPSFTWHADQSGRIVLERVRMEDGKEAWLFGKKTVRNIPAMFEQARFRPADPRYIRLGVALPPFDAADDAVSSQKAPANVPATLSSARALLEGFFRTMDAAESQDSRLVDALAYLDLQSIPQADRNVQGAKLAVKLEAVLRRIHVELSSLPNDWSAPTQVLGEEQGVRVEIVRQRDGCWRFSQNTVSQAPAFLDKLTAQDKTEHDQAAHLTSARDTIATFLKDMRRGDYDLAAECLDMSRFRPGTCDEIGPLLAYKLKFIMDRIGRVYIQEVPDSSEGPRYIFYRGDLGRIVLARKTDGPRAGSWLITTDTVRMIEPMFATVLNQPVDAAGVDGALPGPLFWRTPGIWLRVWVPDVLRTVIWGLQLYQWLGLALAVLLSILVSRLVLAQVQRFFAMVLRKSGSVLTTPYVAARLRPLTCVAVWWMLFRIMALLDLPIHFVDAVLPFKTFGMAFLIGWLGVQLVELATAIYMNSELLRPHRSLGDMVVPMSMRSLKGMILLLVAVYVVYQIGEGESLSRFLTGLGVAGLAASLAAQDTLKCFFSTLLLIGERSFKIGDRISVGGLEGVVEQVGFRATRLRTADGSLLTVPNSTITSAPIDNLTTKTFSRCKATLLVKHDIAPNRILSLRDDIRAWLLEHPKVRKDKVEVSVNRVTESGVEVAVDLHFVDGDAAGEQGLKEEINCELLRLGEILAREENAMPPDGLNTKQGRPPLVRLVA